MYALRRWLGVKYLLYKYENLSSDLQNTHKSQASQYICNSSNSMARGETEARESLEVCKLVTLSRGALCQTLLQIWWKMRTHTQDCRLTLTHTHTHTVAGVYLHTSCIRASCTHHNMKKKNQGHFQYTTLYKTEGGVGEGRRRGGRKKKKKKKALNSATYFKIFTWMVF